MAKPVVAAAAGAGGPNLLPIVPASLTASANKGGVALTASLAGASSSSSSSTAAGAGGGGGAEGDTCLRCVKPIATSQFIRVGDYKFHRGHFTCWGCNADLHGNKFHHKEAQFFCSDCFLARFCHTCRQCRGKIKESHVIQAFGGYYHPEHFVCVTCTQPFVNGKYYEFQNAPYCEEHYFAQIAERCEYCRKPVSSRDMVRVQSAVYHNACLRCHHCGKNLAGADNKSSMSSGAIFQRDSKVYCHEDYMDFFCKRCTLCGTHILKHCISVNDEFYHPDCLKCDVCAKRLEKYICIAGHLRCAAHSSAPTDKFNCSVCARPIDSDVVLSSGKKVHDACFNCSVCKTKLVKATAKLRDGKLCCPACLTKRDERAVKAQADAVAAPLPPGQTVAISLAPAAGAAGAGAGASAAPAAAVAQTVSLQVPGAADGKAALSNSKPAPTASTIKYVDMGGTSTPAEEDGGAAAAGGGGGGGGGTAGGAKRKPSLRPKKSGDMSSSDCKIEWKRGEVLGVGTFGKVYMGMNLATGELIAIKQVRLNTSEDHEQALQIQNEIALMENLRHPNIVSLLGTQRKGNKLNILMEYVPGKSLDTLLSKFGAFSEKIIRSYTRQLTSALAYCHGARVVHRDIKGKNILVDTHGRLKLADFGSAKKFANALSKDAPSVNYNYTPLWTAPEVLVGDYNAKVDVWSLGCVIVEMASAKPPWSEENFENPFRALYHIGNSNAIPKIPDQLSETAKDFVRLCLQRNPDHRPTAAQLLKHKWLEGEPDVDDDGSGGSGGDDDDDEARGKKNSFAEAHDDSDDEDGSGGGGGRPTSAAAAAAQAESKRNGNGNAAAASTATAKGGSPAPTGGAAGAKLAAAKPNGAAAVGPSGTPKAAAGAAGGGRITPTPAAKK